VGIGRVFLSHYQRHPGQLVGLVLILVSAAMLWSGVRALTGAAEEAVARSRAALEPLLSVVRADDAAVGVEDFALLRRGGFCVSPRLTVTFPKLNAPAVIGIDPFTAHCLRQYREQQGQSADDGASISALLAGFDRPILLGSAEDLQRWQQLALPGNGTFELEEAKGLPGGELLADISVADDLVRHGRGQLEILLPASELERHLLPSGYRGQVLDYGVEPDPLVNAFLLSLDALGALALLVAALLVRSVYRFALAQRRRTLDILVRLGVPLIQLRLALIAELLLVALVGATLGMWLGERLASAMAAGFRGTLQGLFDVDALTMTGPSAETWLGMVLILAAVVAWAGMDLLRLRRAQQGRRPVKSRQWLAAFALLAVSLSVLLVTETLWLVFLSALCCLIGAGVLLPELLNRLLARAQAHCRQPLLEWSCSEMRALCRLLQLPLTALAFAIATAIGVHAMVNGFESTFGRWLDQRLQGDLYLDPRRPVATAQWQQRLKSLPGVTGVLPMVRGKGLLNGIPVDVFAVDPDSPLLQTWPFLASVTAHWSALKTEGVMINEQLARRQGLNVGDRVRIRAGARDQLRRVVGIYADYGRPEGEMMLPLSAVSDALPGRYSSFVLSVHSVTQARWRDWPQQYSWLAESRLRDQAGLKQAANAAFDRTFDMTRVLNILTLALAGTALTLMGLVIFRMRQGSYTLLNVYGVPRSALRRRLILHSMLSTGLLALLATPLGIFLGWVLVARVNPAAFGWALPLHLYPLFWLQVWAACLFIGLLVGLLVGNPVRLETLKHE